MICEASLALTTVPRTVHGKTGRGDWIRTSDLHTPSVMRYQAALRPDLAWASRQGRSARQGVRGAGVARRRRKGKAGKWVGRAVTAILALPAIYLLMALIGSLIPVNSRWQEPAQGTTVYIADNGIHADIVMPVSAQGLDWSRVIAPPAGAQDVRWIAFGSGEERVYLDTPTWWDITPRTIWSALTGGKRVMHVEYVPSPSYAARQVRLRPEEYRRLWAAIRADLVLDHRGRPQQLTHSGYGPFDAFYRARGKQSAIRTCNTRVADWLRLAGVKTSLWPPFVEGLTWRYRRAEA